MLYKGTYISGDELKRDEAYTMGYDNVGTHPHHIGVPEVGEILVIDFDHILFDDRSEAVEAAIEHARRGVRVGIHTYAPDDPRLAPAHAEPRIEVEKTHRDVLAALRGRPPGSSPAIKLPPKLSPPSAETDEELEEAQAKSDRE